MMKTPIADNDKKLDIIDHLNQDHSDELLIVANYYGQNSNYSEARISDIFEEGMVIDACHIDRGNLQFYVPFTITGSIEEKILYLAYYALTKQGEKFKGNKRQFFTVGQKSMPSKNIMRIFINGVNPFPEYYAAYSYGFVLKRIDRPQKILSNNMKKGFFMRVFDRVFIWLLRILSSKNRMKLIEQMNSDIRLYTLRLSAQDISGQYVQGAIDVYLHGDSPGGAWIKQLKEGDIIFSRASIKDKHPHLRHGKNVLIGDETAYPALAGILELWSNPEPPIILILMNDPEEKDYFKDLAMPKDTEQHYLIYAEKKQSDLVIDTLKQLGSLDGAWGGLERSEAQKVRHYIRNVLSIDGTKNHIKGYWTMK